MNDTIQDYIHYCHLSDFDGLNIYDTPTNACKTIKSFTQDLQSQKEILTFLVCGNSNDKYNTTFFHNSRKMLKLHNWVEKCKTSFTGTECILGLHLLKDMDMDIIKIILSQDSMAIRPLDTIVLYNKIKDITVTNNYYQIPTILEYMYRLCLSNGTVNALNPNSTIKRQELTYFWESIREDPLSFYWDLGGNRKHALRSMYRTFKLLNIDYVRILTDAKKYAGIGIHPYFDLMISSLNFIGQNKYGQH